MYGRVQTPECGFLVAGYDSIGVVLCTSESDSEISVEERSGKKDTVRHLLVSLALASTQTHLDLPARGPCKLHAATPWGDPRDSRLRKLLTLLRILMIWSSQKRF